MPNALYLYGDIGQNYWAEDTCIQAIDVIEALSNLPLSDGLDIHINSYGGDIGEGLAIMNSIRAYGVKMSTLVPDFKLQAIVDGFAYSAATLLMCAAPTRIMMPGTKAMIHNPLSYCYGDYREMQKTSELLTKSREQTIDLYAQVLGKDAKAIGQMMDDETYLSPDECVKLGLATEACKVTDDKSKEACSSKSAPFPQEGKFSNTQNPYASVMTILQSAEKAGKGGYAKTLSMVKKKMKTTITTPFDLLQQEIDLCSML